ncbi:DUF6543 domain-containing protein [uncultured Pseudomonas sp.]|uniref:dermonecrotic toxin domain-containing protein n=1 Tax=uncultured Pseudomonas sp. TaxID=114707 RepID=UPI0025E90A16|nr:DUF6543 domain-containing protein [uncultured Pseudomonas sp.]
MTTLATPYFTEQALRQRFGQHLKEALGSGRITAAQQQWLQRLLLAMPGEGEPPLPRIDRLSSDTGLDLGAELDAAWIISDSLDAQAPLFLNTLLFGTEAFADRRQLDEAITLRFLRGRSAALELEHVEGDPFVQRSRRILDKEAMRLQALEERLDELPDLRAAMALKLQDELARQVGSANLDVFQHLLQIAIDDPAGTRVLGTQTLIDAACEPMVRAPSRWVFMDAQGWAVSDEESRAWEASLVAASTNLGLYFNRLLDSFWNTPRGNAVSAGEAVKNRLAEVFRRALIDARTERRLSELEFRRLRDLVFLRQNSHGQVWQVAALFIQPLFIKLSGIFVLEPSGTELPGLYLYSSCHGIRRFVSRQALEAYFRTDEGRAEMLLYSSLDEHAALRSTEIRGLRFDLVEDPLFQRQLESIIGLQQRSVQHVLGLPAIAFEHASVRLDDALDVRMPLDRRLFQLRGSLRWAGSHGSFDTRWVLNPRPLRADVVHTTELLNTQTWGGQMKLLALLIDRQAEVVEGVFDRMRQLLNRYLAVCTNVELDAADLWIKFAHTGNRPLLRWALERFSGCAPQKLPADTELLRGASEGPVEPVDQVSLALLEHVLEKVSADFVVFYEKGLRRLFSSPRRWLDTRLRLPAQSSQLRDCALRLDMGMAQRTNDLSDPSLAMVRQALDRPVDSLRHALGAERVEVCRVQLIGGREQPAVRLDETLVLRRESGAGGLVLWALCEGFSEHDSPAALERSLAEQMSYAEVRANWMSQLEFDDRHRLQQYLERPEAALRLELQLEPITGHFIQVMQTEALERQCRAAVRTLRRVQAWRAPAPIIRESIYPFELDESNRRLLDRVTATMQMILADARLPLWVRKASIHQLKELSRIVQRWYVACHSERSFLNDIPEPRAFAYGRLQARLEVDFPGVGLDPDSIMVTLTRYTPGLVGSGETPQSLPAATTQVRTSLTDYAIERFSAAQEGMISMTTSHGGHLDPRLTSIYLDRLVKDLDISAAYRLMLETRFSPMDPDYAQRLRDYAEQVPPLELLRCYSLYVVGRLSETGYRFVEAILNMPEALSRQEVLGRRLVFSPLQLLAAPGMQPDRVPGAFVIAPTEPQTGPWLLYTLFNADFIVQEYSSKQALLDDLHTSESLQALILERLGPFGRRLYANGGFREPHVPFSAESTGDVPWQAPGPVTLLMAPVQGNALRTLFESTGEVMRWWFGRLSVTNAEAEHAKTRFLWTLGVEQVLSLLPGRLGALLGVWQSHGLFKASALDAQQAQWGKAAAEMLAALSLLIAARRTIHETPVESEPESEPSDSESEAVADGPHVLGFPEFSWSNDGMTPELWGRLRPFQVHDVLLNELRHEELLNVYVDDEGRCFVPLAGATYQAARDENGWYILRDDERGPRILVDNQQQWQIDVRGGLRGGGGALTRLSNGLIQVDVNHSMIVEARGMPEIRQRYSNRAMAISEAHAQARNYLETCLDNLAFRDAAGARHSSVDAWVAEFFGTPQPDARLYGELERTVRVLYQELMDSSLSPWNSSRYVVGTRRYSGENTLAFTFPREPQKCLYLTERFFLDPVCRLKPSVRRIGQFNVGTHFRAAVLLHELSHLYCATEDIAYLESHMPFVDLLDDNSTYRRGLKAEMLVHQNGLSHRTPSDRLFYRHNDDGTWQDLGSEDPKVLRKIFVITGKKTLAQARSEFYANVQVRTDVMLANADTVALLVTQLGRRRLVPE